METVRIAFLFGVWFSHKLYWKDQWNYEKSLTSYFTVESRTRRFSTNYSGQSHHSISTTNTFTQHVRWQKNRTSLAIYLLNLTLWHSTEVSLVWHKVSFLIGVKYCETSKVTFCVFTENNSIPVVVVILQFGFPDINLIWNAFALFVRRCYFK